MTKQEADALYDYFNHKGGAFTLHEIFTALYYDDNGRKKFDEPKDNTVKINLNERIKVKLTATGIKAYVDYMNEPNVAAKHGQPVKTKYLLPTIDDEGYTTFQLWEFMSIFGQYFYMANTDQVIDPLEIIKCEPEVWTLEGQKKWDGEHQ